MVNPEFYVGQYSRLVSVIDEAIAQLDAGRYDYVKTILNIALLTAEKSYIRASESGGQVSPRVRGTAKRHSPRALAPGECFFMPLS